MKRIYSILIFCMFCFTQLWSQDLWQQANEAYSKENYSKAIALYEQLIQQVNEARLNITIWGMHIIKINNIPRQY